MDQITALADLHRHQHGALTLLAEALETIEDGRNALLAASPSLRERIGAALGAYQRFKHDGIFDPAIGSGDAERIALGRAMKVECIAAGEVFRTHLKRWPAAAIADDWASYKVAARLTVNGVRRHLAVEREGIELMIDRYGEARAA